MTRNDPATRRHVRRQLSMDRPRVGPSILAASVGINLLALALPLVLLQIFDRVIPFGSLDTLTVLSLGLLAALVLDLAFKLCRITLLGVAGEDYERALTRRVVAHVLGARTDDFARVRSGTHLDRQDAIAALRDAHAGSSRLLAIDLPFTLVFVAMIWLVGGALVVVPLGCFAVLIAVRWLMHRVQAPVLRQRRAVDERRYSFLGEFLSQIETVKAFGMEAQMLRRYEALQDNSVDAGRKLTLVTQASHAFGAVFSQAAIAAMGLFGAHLVITGRLGVGEMAACMLLNGRTIQPMLKTLGLWVQVEAVGESRRRLADLFATPQREPVEAPPLDGALSLREVTLPDRDAAALPAISVELAPGGCLGVAGPDGSGKTALLGMLQGEIDAPGVLIDGRPATEFAERRGRGGIVYLDRTPVIFEGTIRENLSLFGDADAFDRAAEIARRLGLEAEIHRLPDGYETRLGDGLGANLGRLQRIAIARALALEPRILILNQANTALDHHADAAVLCELQALWGDTTLVIASSRPSWLALADVTVDLGRGEVRRRLDAVGGAPAAMPLPTDRRLSA
jgi:ATP-binding cassette subfamily C protein LapB